MSKTPYRRNSDYYLRRIERDYPEIYKNYMSGKYGSVNEAARAAGIKKMRTTSQELQNAWSKATAAERESFLKSQGLVLAPAPPPAAAGTPIAVDGRLQATAKARISYILSSRNMTYGQVMDELGFKRLNPSLGNALTQGTKLQPAMIKALEKWLLAHAGT